MDNKNSKLLRYTYPSRLDKMLHTLEGIIKGIAIDGQINQKEIKFLEEWLTENENVANHHPFNELFPVIQEAIVDGIIDGEEREDIIWLCNKLKTDNQYFDAVTSDMQRLQAILGGIMADGVISKDELSGLKGWLTGHIKLRKCWPYDELESLLIHVLADGKIDEDEHQMLLRFFNDFTAIGGDRVIGNPDIKIGQEISGVCIIDPIIDFENKMFCFTGKSARLSRSDLAHLVENYGGKFTNSMGSYVDYLIIGADGSPAWSFACYGRKVEMAIELRKQGKDILIVHENDFWDAILDFE